MKLRIPFLAICLLPIAVVLPGTVLLQAQATTASIHGTVIDSTGAVLPNATVTVVNTSTSISATQKTDSKGYFIFPDLHIGGPYTVTVGNGSAATSSKFPKRDFKSSFRRGSC
jgi:Carboxypeptidase regulatory-like domain